MRSANLLAAVLIGLTHWCSAEEAAVRDPGAGRRQAVAIAQPLEGRKIVLDPGHAVMSDQGRIINPGAKARRGVHERDVVLNVADKLVPLLEAQGAKVYVTRTRGNPWRYNGKGKQNDNRSRAIFANTLRADAYVRLHCDWNRSRKFKGFTIYYFRWGSRSLAKHLRRGLAEALPGRRDHGLHRRTFVSVTSTMPAVLLELGVLSNRKEGKELGSDSHQTRLAEAISNGLVGYFSGLPKKVRLSAVDAAPGNPPDVLDAKPLLPDTSSQ